MSQVIEQQFETSQIASISTGHQFVNLISKDSVSTAIGADILNISEFDTNQTICQKISRASHTHPEHLLEVVLAGLMSIVYNSETKQEILESCVFAMSIADRTLAH